MTEEPTRRRPRRWPRRVLGGALAATALLSILGFLVLPPVVKHLVETELGKLLGRRVSVGHVRANPFSLSLTIDDFQVFEADASTPFVGFRRLYVNAQWESLYRRAPVVREIRLESPRVRVVRLKATSGAWADATTYNFSDLLVRLSSLGAAPEPRVPPDQAPARFSLNNIHVSDGDLTFDDRPLGSKHEISGLDLGVPFVSTLPTFIDTFVVPGLRLVIDGTPFSLAGRTKPFKDSLETTIELRAAGFDLTRYLPYLPVPLRFDVVSALLDVNVDVSFVRPSSDGARLTARGRVALDQVVLREKGGPPLVSLRQLEVVVSKADLLAREFKVDRVTVDGVEVHARRLADGTLNLERLAPAPAPASRTGAGPPVVRPPPAAPEATPRFSIGEITVKDVALHLRDETVHPSFALDVDQLTLSARGFSNAPGARGSLTLALHAMPGGTLKDEGSFTLTPLAAQGTVTLEGMEPSRFTPYFREQIAFDLRQGRVRVGAGYQLGGLGAPVAPAVPPAGSVPASGAAPAVAPHFELSDAFIEVRDLALRRRDAKDDFFDVADFAVRGVKVDPALRTIDIRELATHGGRLHAERNEHGVVDLSTLAATAARSPSTSARAVPTATPQAPAPAGGEPPSPWSVSLARLECEGWSARFDDHLIRPAATLAISPIGIKATGLSTSTGARGTLDLRLGINHRGRLTVTGSATLQPLSADLRLDLHTLEILPLQPYFADQLNLVITDGDVSAKGRVKVEMAKTSTVVRGDGASSAAPGPRVTFGGDIDIASFASVDGSKHEEFLKWKSFHVGQLAVTTLPLAVSIQDVALTDFFSRLVIFPDAHFNVRDIVSQPAAPAASPSTGLAAPPRTPPPTTKAGPREDEKVAISIGQVTLQGGHVSFSDRLIRPNYSAELTELAGRISGLSADGATQADVDIRGSVNHSGSLTVVGKANPLAKDLFVDVKATLKEFELPTASPYAGKYAGYGISKGKLALALDYHIADRKLDAKNRLVVEQFTFGDKVDSADATRLPVRLAVAILKDRHGVIDIDLPIAGSLDNPDFKIGHAVLKVLGNLIVKAATAPFALIGSLFGGGDELSHVDFAQGDAALDARAGAKLASLGKALSDRPGLSFEIEGSADPVRDRENLKRHLCERGLKVQKMLELVQSGAPVSDPETVSFDSSERRRLLQKAYLAATFPKPRNVLGRPKELPPEEMEKLLLANTLVDDDALRDLAVRRATLVREALAKLTPDGPTRLFLVAPRLRKPPEGAGNRVDFKLKKE